MDGFADFGCGGRRLAKRHGDTTLRRYRDAGVTAERIVGWLAWTCGLADASERPRAGDLVERFDLGRVPRAAVVFRADL